MLCYDRINPKGLGRPVVEHRWTTGMTMGIIKSFMVMGKVSRRTFASFPFHEGVAPRALSEAHIVDRGLTRRVYDASPIK
jgi:hypothetical protein